MAQTTPQRITRLIPLREALGRIEAAVRPVVARQAQPRAALSRALAEHVAVACRLPAAPLALRDGYAVTAELTADAGAYAPAPLPLPVRVDAGEPLPPGADAVAPLDAVGITGGQAQALAPVAPGDGVLAAAADADPALPLRPAGERLRRIDLAMLAAAGINCVRIREPRVRIALAGPFVEAAGAMIAAALEADGGAVISGADPALDAALDDRSADAVIAVGGTGMGRGDSSIDTLARLGQVAFHGVGIAPGETAAFGSIGQRPVLLVPGRLDAALAVYVLLARPMLEQLAGAPLRYEAAILPLKRKVVSPIGLAEIVPVRRDGDAVEPLAGGYLPLQALARSDGFILVQPESEGFAPGTPVAVSPWP